MALENVLCRTASACDETIRMLWRILGMINTLSGINQSKPDNSVTHFTNSVWAHNSISLDRVALILSLTIQSEKNIWTCHESSAVVPCTKLWVDLIIIFMKNQQFSFKTFGSWARIMWVTCAPGHVQGTDRLYMFYVCVCVLATRQYLRNVEYTVYPKKYAHGFCFAVLCCGYTLTDFPISIRLTSLALWQSNDCPSASKATLMNMDKYFMWIHYERLHNHNKAKHNKTVCIFLGIYCIYMNKC